MADIGPAYDDQRLLARIGDAARGANLGAHREVFARMRPALETATVVCGVLAVALGAAEYGFLNEFVTRTDQSGRTGDIVGMACIAPFFGLFAFASLGSLYTSIFRAAAYRAVRLDLYVHGVVYTSRGKERVARYDSTVVRHEVGVYSPSKDPRASGTHIFTLLDVTGRKFGLTDYSQGGPPYAAHWGAAIEEGVAAAQLPAAIEKLNRGGIVSFGPVWATSHKLGEGENSVPWSEVHQIALMVGAVHVRAAGGRWLPFTTAPTRKIPNLALLLAVGNTMIANRHGHTISQAPTPSTTRPVDTADFRLLLSMVLGDHPTAERLIAYERDQHPNATRAAWITEAINRLRRER